MMLGMFRLVENEKTLVIELFSLVEKPEGIDLYFRHFTPALVPWEKPNATFLKLVSLDPEKSTLKIPSMANRNAPSSRDWTRTPTFRAPKSFPKRRHASDRDYVSPAEAGSRRIRAG